MFVDHLSYAYKLNLDLHFTWICRSSVIFLLLSVIHKLNLDLHKFSNFFRMLRKSQLYRAKASNLRTTRSVTRRIPTAFITSKRHPDLLSGVHALPPVVTMFELVFVKQTLGGSLGFVPVAWSCLVEGSNNITSLPWRKRLPARTSNGRWTRIWYLYLW